MLVGIEIVSPSKIVFPKIEPNLLKNVPQLDFASLDQQTQDLLIGACEEDMLFMLKPEIR